MYVLIKSESQRSIVLPLTEWERIKRSVSGTQGPTTEEKRQAERRSLHEASKKTVEGWGNTLVAQRQQKLDARKRRQEEEEVCI